MFVVIHVLKGFSGLSTRSFEILAAVWHISENTAFFICAVVSIQWSAMEWLHINLCFDSALMLGLWVQICTVENWQFCWEAFGHDLQNVYHHPHQALLVVAGNLLFAHLLCGTFLPAENGASSLYLAQCGGKVDTHDPVQFGIHCFWPHHDAL